MKKYIFTTYLFYKVLWIFGILIFIISCNRNQTLSQPEFDLNTPGGQIVKTHEDGSPKEIDYYKIDENGNQTNELIGVAEFYPNLQEFRGGGLNEGKRNGQWYAFFPDGAVQVDAFYVNGNEHGHYTVYRENGTAYYKGHYDNGICDGTWYWYDENGNQTKKIKANKNTIACGYCKKCLTLKKR